MPQKPFNLSTDPRGVFEGQGLEGPGGFADVLSNRAQKVEQRQGMGNIFDMSAKQLQEYAKPIEGFIGASGILRIPRPFIGTSMSVLKNPTAKQAKEFMKKTKQNEVRTIVDFDTRNMYIFDAWEGAHSSIGKVLGLDLSKIKWGASMQNTDTQIDSLFNRFKTQ